MGSREQRRRQKRAEPAAEHPHWRLLEHGVSSEEGAEGGVVSEGCGGAAASALLSPRRAALMSSGLPGACAGGVRVCVRA